MANITLSIPNAVIADLEAALREQLGRTASGMTQREVFATWVRNGIRPLLKSYRQRRDGAALVATEVAARLEKEAALEAERVARVAAERAVETTLESDLAAIA